MNQDLYKSLTLTLVRHGESIDNLKSIWAGHRDSPLSNFGYAQAQRLGNYFKDIHFDKIYASDLQRARLTANEIHRQNLFNKPLQEPQTDIKIITKTQELVSPSAELIITSILREQNFGKAEGQPWDSNQGSVRDFYSNRKGGFDGGESFDDVRNRAREFFDQVLLPVWSSLSIQKIQPHNRNQVHLKTNSPHICIVSHGIFISEFVGLLNSLSPYNQAFKHTQLSNTGWTRIQLLTESISMTSRQLQSPIIVEVVASNQTAHLANLQRQGGGIGSGAYDPKQAKLDTFFTSK
ncbi:hypothetical protein O181_014312 [Austropuccinia psidii MF-1]|uniref:Phosphoglycerate mutase n=1 Tax=Austropuccinia psidii MF-1 TaxID=1389203 RepID=A0A9Q3GPQ6_9BASI|nr:hypothetical protein [Austropuccinia psidii MF-1]